MNTDTNQSSVPISQLLKNPEVQTLLKEGHTVAPVPVSPLSLITPDFLRMCRLGSALRGGRSMTNFNVDPGRQAVFVIASNPDGTETVLVTTEALAKSFDKAASQVPS